MNRVVFNDGWAVKKCGDSHEFNLRWEKVALPHDAVIATARNEKQFNGTKKAFFENGAWEYVKVFHAPEEWKGKDVLLEFEGVYNHALVYLNGNFLASHAYGYTEFTVKLTEFLKIGAENVLKVVCKTNDDSRWYTGAGIYRNVNLLVAQKLHIKNNGLKITTLSADKEKAAIRIEVELSRVVTAGCELTAEIIKNGAIVLSAVQSGKRVFYFNLENPALWSDETPELYVCRITLKKNGLLKDVAEEKFGIRTLSVSAQTGLLVNGKRVNLRGACIHHDNGVIGVREYRDAAYRRIQKLKQAGFNAIRSAHHPASRYLLQACDELGMYVMEEAFDVWQLPKSSDDYANDFNGCWKEDIRAMIEKDYNHPSVILYSIGNEISDLAGAAGVGLAKKISREVKRLDGTRFTTVAINGLLLLMQKMETAKLLTGEANEPKKDINEAMSSLDDVMVKINNAPSMDQIILGGTEAVDIAGYNYMHNRYAPDIEKYPDRVIVGSETYAKYIPEMWDHIKSHTNVIGDFTWTGWDYLGETGIGLTSYEERDYHDGFYGVYPCITADCGDFDITGYRTPQSYFREIVFGLRKEPYIAVHNPAMCGKREYLSTWGWGDVVSSWSFDGYEGVPLQVDVYAEGEVKLFLNSKSLGGKPCERYRCNFTVPFERGKLEAVTWIGGKEYRYELTTADDEVCLQMQPENKTVRAGGLIFVNLALTDKNGVVHYGKDRKITIRAEGCALLGFGSGAPKTTESYQDSEHTTYHGRAFAVFMASQSGTAIILAQTDDGLKAECSVKITE